MFKLLIGGRVASELQVFGNGEVVYAFQVMQTRKFYDIRVVGLKAASALFRKLTTTMRKEKNDRTNLFLRWVEFIVINPSAGQMNPSALDTVNNFIKRNVQV